MNGPCVVICGNLADGFTVHGPFGCAMEGVAWADNQKWAHDWIIVPMHQPKEEEEQEAHEHRR